MPIKKLTLKEWKELGLPVHRSYVQFHSKPIPHQKFKKLLDAASKFQEVKKNEPRN